LPSAAAASTPSSAQPSSPVRAQAVDPTLSAAYRTESTRVSGYDASITIKNVTGQPVKEWTVIVTLPLLDVGVHDVAGAVPTENGNQVTFTPVDETRTVPAGSTVRLTFQVDGLGKPTACAVDGRPCSGVPE
jgi:endoglucanase